MGKGARRTLSRELRAESATERGRRGQTFGDVRRRGGILESEAQRLIRGEQTPEVEATRTFWDTQREAATNRLAITGNRAGYGALQLELGREEGRQVSDVTRRGRMRGVDILGRLRGEDIGLYGGEGGYLSNLYGERGRLARAPKFWQQAALAAIGGAGQAAGAYYGAKGKGK